LVVGVGHVAWFADNSATSPIDDKHTLSFLDEEDHSLSVDAVAMFDQRVPIAALEPIAVVPAVAAGSEEYATVGVTVSATLCHSLLGSFVPPARLAHTHTHTHTHNIHLSPSPHTTPPLMARWHLATVLFCLSALVFD
jgi:hypothetical protein